MRAKLNDVVVVEWDDALPEKAVVVGGDVRRTMYEVFFPERKRNRVMRIRSKQIVFISGQIKV